MYYLRFTNNAQADLERGYSFAGYMLFSNREQAIEEFSLLDGADFDEDLVVQDNVTGMWGRRLSGLCGFSFDSIDEAITGASDLARRYGGKATIYEGSESFDSDIDGADDEGTRFIPHSIAAEVE